MSGSSRIPKVGWWMICYVKETAELKFWLNHQTAVSSTNSSQRNAECHIEAAHLTFYWLLIVRVSLDVDRLTELVSHPCRCVWRNPGRREPLVLFQQWSIFEHYRGHTIYAKSNSEEVYKKYIDFHKKFRSKKYFFDRNFLMKIYIFFYKPLQNLIWHK